MLNVTCKPYMASVVMLNVDMLSVVLPSGSHDYSILLLLITTVKSFVVQASVWFWLTKIFK